MNSTIRLLASVCAVLCSLTLSSCNKQNAPQAETPQVPKPWTGLTQDVRAVWSAEPNIDLINGPAVVVRAYVESYFLAMKMGTIDVAYPGFTRAVPPTTSTSSPFTDPWPDTSHPSPYRIVGTDKRHILRMDSVGRSVVSIVCDYTAYTHGLDRGDGTFGYKPGGDDDGVGIQRIAMTAPERTTGSLPPQRGPAPAPATDVFGRWQVETMQWGVFEDDPRWPNREADAAACRNLAPDPVERRVALRKGAHPRSDYPTLPPYPGWPEAGPA